MMNAKELIIDVNVMKDAALVLRALNNDLRQQLLHVINKMQKATVTEIYIKLRLEQSVASQHLAILRNTGFVNTEKVGKFIYYSINYERLNEVQELGKNILDLKHTQKT